MGKKKEFTVRPFDKLRKTIERKDAASASPPVRQKKKEEYSEEELFCREMDDVQEIGAFRILNCEKHHPKDLASSRRANADRETLAVLGEIATGQRPIHLPDTQEYVEWTSPDYHETIISKLHEGHFSVQDAIDLHGCTVHEAEVELGEFLQSVTRKGLRCVKIIHGRGLRSVKGPRLKDAVTRRLSGKYKKYVIAFVSARQCDGGLGALYVLLKKT
jgi:DNA-nicking Smr family endonuclease